MVEYLPEAFLLLDLDGDILYHNREIEKLTGFAGYSFPQNIMNLIIEEFHEQFRFTLASMRSERSYERSEVVLRGERSFIPVSISVNPVYIEDDVVGLRAIIMDITRRRALEEKLYRSEERFRILSDTTLEGIVLHDNWRIVDANQAFNRMFGYSLEEVIGKSIFDFLDRKNHDLVRSYFEQRKDHPCQVSARRKNNQIIEVEFLARSLYREGREVFFVSIRDITAQKQYEYIQEHEELTGLLNIKGFNRRLQEHLNLSSEKRKKIAVMTIRHDRDQLNVLKNVDPDMERILINALPIEIAERLVGIFFGGDVVARTGENEYMTIHPIPDTDDPDNTVKLIYKLLSVFNEEFLQGIRLKAVAGVTLYPDDIKVANPFRLITQSRHACDEAFTKGSEYVFYNEQSHRETRERIEFIRDLIIAVREERCRDLFLMYQPKVESSGRIMGMEALVRWNHARWNGPHGFVPPDRFISPAEEVGLIGEIGQFVLEEACRQTVKWLDENETFSGLQLAVNVSPSQLTESFVDEVNQILERTGLPPHSLELEITERESVKEQNIRVLSGLREKNISIAIDDFGIAYSALSLLPKLPVNTIKLDKSYIANIVYDVDYEKLVACTIDMVHGFSYNVVAEGVEEMVQAEKLFSEMKCDRIQGFYYYHPMLPEEFEREVLENRNFSEN